MEEKKIERDWLAAKMRRVYFQTNFLQFQRSRDEYACLIYCFFAPQSINNKLQIVVFCRVLISSSCGLPINATAIRMDWPDKALLVRCRLTPCLQNRLVVDGVREATRVKKCYRRVVLKVILLYLQDNSTNDILCLVRDHLLQQRKKPIFPVSVWR